MEEEREIQVDTFVDLFMAISYAHEQRYFNITSLFGYLCQTDSEDEVLGQVLDIVDKMVVDEVLIPEEGYDYLYQISNKIDYMNIIKDNIEYLNDMKKFFLSYYNRSELNIKLVNSNNKQK